MELLVAIFIVSVGVMAFVGSYRLISTSLHQSRRKTVANLLLEEKMQQLKEFSYYQLLVTTTTTIDSHFSPALSYDSVNYPPETITEGKFSFIRASRVDFAYRYGASVSTAIWTTQDTGLKLLTVYVMYQEGNTWKYEMLQNVFSNPIYNPVNAQFLGHVKNTSGNNLNGAYIRVLENSGWFNYTNSAGNYSFGVSPGTYSLQCSLLGYYTATTTGYITITDGQPYMQDFTLAPISTGAITSNIYEFNSLVISQVASSTGDINGGFEYVELYNPTELPINVKNFIDLVHWNSDSSTTTVALTYISTYVPTNRYYLITNSPNPMTVGGVTLTPDAYYSDPAYQAPMGHLISSTTWSGAMQIVKHSNNQILDSVGWGVAATTAAPAGGTEAIPITPLTGPAIVLDEQFIRMTDPGYVRPAYGNAYDSGSNNINFIDRKPIVFAPHNVASAPLPPIAGVPAPGALVNSTDPLSPTVHSIAGLLGGIYPIATFTIPTIATGTWNIYAYHSRFGKNNFTEVSNVLIEPNISTGVPNGATTPAWGLAGSTTTLLTSTTNYAIVTGVIRDGYGTPQPNIRVNLLGVGTYTASDGSYLLIVPPGTGPLYANFNYSNPSYTLGVNYLVGLAAGNVYGPGGLEDIPIYLGGTLQGFFKTATGTPLAGKSVVAVFGGGNQYSQAVSDSYGYFYLRNITTGTYTITPALDAAETCEPASLSGLLASTGTATYVSTFTITNALGKVSGQVTKSGAAITTGALIIATTSTITGAPPALTASAGALCSPCYYSDISDANGKFSIDLRSASAPYNIYGWYNTTDPDGTVTLAQLGPYSVSISTGQSKTQNFAW